MEPDLLTWGAAIRRDPAVRRRAISVAWALSEAIAIGLLGEDDTALAARTGVALSTAKNALSELRGLGYVACAWTRIDGRRVRLLRPTLPAPRSDNDPILDVPGPEADAPACPDGRYSPEVDADAPLVLAAHTPGPPSPDLAEGSEDRKPGSANTGNARPVWEWSSADQERRARSRAIRFVARHYAQSGYLRCNHDFCGVRASTVCGEDGALLCQDHRRHAEYPVVISSLYDV